MDAMAQSDVLFIPFQWLGLWRTGDGQIAIVSALLKLATSDTATLEEVLNLQPPPMCTHILRSELLQVVAETAFRAWQASNPNDTRQACCANTFTALDQYQAEDLAKGYTGNQKYRHVRLCLVLSEESCSHCFTQSSVGNTRELSFDTQLYENTVIHADIFHQNARVTTSPHQTWSSMIMRIVQPQSK